MPGIAVHFILEHMNLFDLRTVTVMYRDIQKALEDENLPHRETWVSLTVAFVQHSPDFVTKRLPVSGVRSVTSISVLPTCLRS